MKYELLLDECNKPSQKLSPGYASKSNFTLEILWINQDNLKLIVAVGWTAWTDSTWERTERGNGSCRKSKRGNRFSFLFLCHFLLFWLDIALFKVYHNLQTEFGREVPLFEVEATAVEPVFQRLYSYIFDTDSVGSSVTEMDRPVPSAIFIVNFDKVQLISLVAKC